MTNKNLYKSPNRFSVLVIAAALIVGWATVSVGDSRFRQIINADVGAIKDVYLNTVKTELDKTIAELKDARNKYKEGDGQWRKLNAELEKHQTKKKKLEKVELGVAMYSNTKKAKDAMEAIIVQAQKSKKGFDVNPDALAGNRIAALDSFKALNKVKSGKDYYDKIKALAKDLRRLKESELSPATRKLTQSMTDLTKLMEEFGDKVPVVGEVIKAYGQIGGGLVAKAAELDNAFSKLEQGQLIKNGVGNRGLRAIMAKKVPDCSNDPDIVAWEVSGAPRVYQNSCDVLIWNSEKENWHSAKKAYPGKTAAALREMVLSRYTTYLAHEVLKPTPYQLLQGFEKAVVLNLTPSKTAVKANEGIYFTATGKWLQNMKPVQKNLKVKFTKKKLNLLTATGGEFALDGDGMLNRQMAWTAPEDTKGTYYLQVEVNEKEYFSVRAAHTSVTMGEPGAIQVTLNESGPVSVGSSIKLEALLVNEEGTPYLKKEAGGRFTVTCQECEEKGGTQLAFAANATHAGVIERWKLPDVPGEYTFHVAYEPGRFGKHAIVAEPKTDVATVVPPTFSLTVSPEVATVDENEEVVYEWIVHNEDTLPLTLRLRRQMLRSQRDYWIMGEMPKEITLAPGEERRIPFAMKVLDKDNAKIQKVKWIACPNMVVGEDAANWEQSAIVEARNNAFSDELIPSVNGVAYDFGGQLPTSVATRAHALKTISERLDVLKRKKAALSQSIAASAAEIRTFISYYKERDAVTPALPNATAYSFLGKKWYPAWARMFADFSDTGISNCMTKGNQFLVNMGAVSAAANDNGATKINWQNGFSYYVQLNHWYYLNLEKSILTSLKQLVDQFGDEPMPEELAGKYTAAYANRKRTNGDVGPHSTDGNYLPFEKAVYDMLAAPEQDEPDTEDTEADAVFSPSQFVGTWTGTMVPVGEAAKLAKRHGGGVKVESAKVIISEKDGKLYADLSHMHDEEDGMFGLYKNEILEIQGNQVIWERRDSQRIGALNRSRTFQMRQGFVGELQGDGNVIFGYVRLQVFDFDIQFKMVLTKSGSGAVADQSPSDLDFDPMGLASGTDKKELDEPTFLSIPSDDGIARGHWPAPTSVFRL